MWKHIEGLFIFLPIEDADNTRTITWFGQKKATRAVFERKYKKHEPERVFSIRDFSFSVSFVRIDSDWYLSITPDWFFSHGDQCRQSAFGDKLISGKRKGRRIDRFLITFDSYVLGWRTWILKTYFQTRPCRRPKSLSDRFCSTEVGVI